MHGHMNVKLAVVRRRAVDCAIFIDWLSSPAVGFIISTRYIMNTVKVGCIVCISVAPLR